MANITQCEVAGCLEVSGYLVAQDDNSVAKPTDYCIRCSNVEIRNLHLLVSAFSAPIGRGAGRGRGM